jgi:tetratricopeptide (TPR) repeat protein
MRLKLLIINLLVVLTLSASTATDAEKYYRAEDWAKAETLYAQLLKKSPNNRIYNHRYGVSLYEQEKDLANAEKHLLRSKKAGISLSAFYLGRVCFLQYKFDDAIANYEFYISRSNDKENKQAIKEYLPKCEQVKV